MLLTVNRCVTTDQMIKQMFVGDQETIMLHADALGPPHEEEYDLGSTKTCRKTAWDRRDCVLSTQNFVLMIDHLKLSGDLRRLPRTAVEMSGNC